MNEQLNGPRALVFGCLFGIIFWASVLFGAFLYSAKADHMACSRPVLTMPRTYQIDPWLNSTDAQIYRDAFAEVQSHSGGYISFVEVPFYGSYNADIEVLSSWYWSTGYTWVQMPCGATTHSNIFVADDVSQPYWAAHEIMHTLSLADHITHSVNPANYINPAYCDDDSNPYVGVMSYCSSRYQWWGAGDQYLFWRWF